MDNSRLRRCCLSKSVHFFVYSTTVRDPKLSTMSDDEHEQHFLQLTVTTVDYERKDPVFWIEAVVCFPLSFAALMLISYVADSLFSHLSDRRTS